MNATVKFPVILPSETQSREFDAKLLLACYLAERGHPVVVGSRIEIHNRIHRLPRGLYLAKDIRESSRRIFQIMEELGFGIVAWDEEAIVITNPAAYHERRVDPQNLKQIKAFCAWGSYNRELVESAPGYRGTPVFETGNPRTDLLTPQCRGFFAPDVDALRARFGEFILINSNFGKLNHFLKSQTAQRTADGGYINSGAGTSEWWDYRRQVFQAFKTMVPAIARAFPDRQIVIRPHPSEGHEVWRDASDGLSNVTVIHEGSVHPWIMASAVAIHNGCTTGLESYLLDHPVITYKTIESDDFPRQLSDLVSSEVNSESALVGTLTRFFDGGSLPAPAPEAKALAEAQVGPLDGTLASERIGKLLERHGEDWLAPRPAHKERLRGYMRASVRQTTKQINAYRPDHKNSRDYNAHRFPGLTVAQVTGRLGALSDLLGRFKGIGARQIHPNVFMIEPHPPKL